MDYRNRFQELKFIYFHLLYTVKIYLILQPLLQPSNIKQYFWNDSRSPNRHAREDGTSQDSPFDDADGGPPTARGTPPPPPKKVPVQVNNWKLV